MFGIISKSLSDRSSSASVLMSKIVTRLGCFRLRHCRTPRSSTWYCTASCGPYAEKNLSKKNRAHAKPCTQPRENTMNRWMKWGVAALVLLVLTACVIIGREIAISALREWMAELGQRTRVAVSPLGKYKTILQMIGLSLMLYRYDLFGLPIYNLGVVLSVVAAVLTLWSMIAYIRSAWPTLTAAQ